MFNMSVPDEGYSRNV